MLHLYSAFLGTQIALHSKGGISSTTTNVQHPPGWCDNSHIAPQHPPHTSLLVERRQSDEANQCMRMIIFAAAVFLTCSQQHVVDVLAVASLSTCSAAAA